MASGSVRCGAAECCTRRGARTRRPGRHRPASVCRIAGVLTDRSGGRPIACTPPAYGEGRPQGHPPVGTIEQECVPQDIALSDTLTACGDRDDRGPPVEPVPDELLLGRDTT